MKTGLIAGARRGFCALFALLLLGRVAQAEPPGIAYVFPAGAQRGTTVEARVGGYYFHGDARLHLEAEGVRAEPRLEPMETLFFHGPLIAKPASQGREDYPKDYRATIAVSAAALLGSHSWSCSTVQGVTNRMKFVVGDLPEMVESEVEGPMPPVPVRLPLTVNGRIFPREDTDAWSFPVEKGERITCAVQSRELGSPLQAVLELFDSQGCQILPQNSGNTRFGDPYLSFVAVGTGTYHVRVRDAGFGGGQAYVYRLSLYRGGRVTGVFPLGGPVGGEVPVLLHEAGADKPAVARLRVPARAGLHGLANLHASPAAAGMLFEASELPEAVRSASGEITGLQDGLAPFPGVLNGCILAPGESHPWRIRLEPKATLRAEVVASVLGSRLDSVLSLVDAAGREVAKNDDAVDGRSDSALQYTSEKGGEFVLQIRERFGSRHGNEFGYRLHVTHGEPVDFQLRLAADFINIARAEPEAAVPSDAKAEGKPEAKPAVKSAPVKVEVLGAAGNLKEISLEVEGLPAGVSFEPKAIPAKAKSVDLRFTAAPDVPWGSYPVRIHGVLKEGDVPVRRTALVPGAEAARIPEGGTTLRLGVVPRVPFKFSGDYWITVDQPSGTRMTKTYRIERNGYEGPLRAMLSDKQIRCLQRAGARPVDIPTGAQSFEFAVDYPTEVQLGWTSRIQLMLVGTVRDVAGREHPVSYTSSDVDDQMISVLTSGWLGIQCDRLSFPGTPGVVEIPVRVRRHDTLRGQPVRVGLRIPGHMRGVQAAEMDLGPDQQDGVLRARVEPGAGPFNLPLEVVATTVPKSPEEASHTAAVAVEFLSETPGSP